MPCFYPLQAQRYKYLRSGSYSAPFFGTPAQNLPPGIIVEDVALPCGQCIGCRLEKSREWAVRCVYEASLYKDNCFITLTYDPEHLPKDHSLKKRHWELFMKRLRKAYPKKRIRFFACGEYGDNTHRPHYHALLFNHTFEDLVEKTVVNEHGLSRFKHSPKLEKIWGMGLCSVGDLTFESAAYCARYCLKKVNGDQAEWHYFGRESEFSRMSRMPGIAAGWWKKYGSDVVSLDCTFSRGKRAPVPRYFDKLLGKVDEALLKVIKDKRMLKVKDKFDFSAKSIMTLWRKAEMRKEMQKKHQRKF